MKQIKSDMTEAIPLKDQLEDMSKAQKIKFASEVFGYKIDSSLDVKVIDENILKMDANRKSDALKVNEQSLEQVSSEKDPKIKIRFFNMESPGTDLEFSYSEPLGMRGPRNKKGHKKCPRYHLFHGEEVTIAYSVFEHLQSLTYVTHKNTYDQGGLVKGAIPIIKPRFVLQPTFTKDQLQLINK